MVRYRTIKEEVHPDTVRSDALRQALAAEDTLVNASLYLLLRAVDRFYAIFNRFPGTFKRWARLASECICVLNGVMICRDCTGPKCEPCKHGRQMFAAAGSVL